jgi:hypothetical protein
MGNGAPWMLTVAVGTTVKLGNSLTGRSSMRSHCSSHGRAPLDTSSHSRSWRRHRPGRPWLQLPLRQRYALCQIACKGQEATEVWAGSTRVRGKAAARGQHLCCCPTGDGEGASSLNRMPKRTLNTSHHWNFKRSSECNDMLFACKHSHFAQYCTILLASVVVFVFFELGNILLSYLVVSFASV